MATFRATTAAALVGMLLTGCEDGAAPAARSGRVPVASPERSDTAVIGLVGTMSGPQAWRGDESFEGADVGVQVLNRTRDGGRAFELVTLDDRGSPGRATRLVRDLAASDRTAGILYAGPPQGLPPAQQALADAGLPAVLLYGDLYTARLLRRPLFQASPPLLWQARRLASYLLEDRGYRKIGMLVEGSMTGRTARRALSGALAEEGARGPAVEPYTPADGDLRRALQRLKRRRVEAVVVQGGPAALSQATAVLDDMGSLYRTTSRARLATARPNVRRRRLALDHWRPQLAGFDLALVRSRRVPPAGTVATAAYDRGAHYLPVPSFRRFREAYKDWWGGLPLGRQLRAFEAVRVLGWAAARVTGGRSAIDVLERLRDRRFGGTDITLGPDDHVLEEPTAIGLWVVPRPGADVRDRRMVPRDMPWVPLARGFSIDGEVTDLPPQDWKHLFRKAPPPKAPPPPFKRMRFGVTTGRGDPVH